MKKKKGANKLKKKKSKSEHILKPSDYDIPYALVTLDRTLGYRQE